MRYTIENGSVKCMIDSHGAELKSLVRKEDGREFLWYADATYWNRTSPVLFPFVGAVKDKLYRYNGKEYTMGQHGFARDMEFSPDSQDREEIWFVLTESEESLSDYPFGFRLKIGYRLEGSSVKVMWSVKNTNSGEMYFAIGAHPGFLVKSLDGHAFRLYDKTGKTVSQIRNRKVAAGGCVKDESEEISVPGGRLAISKELFDNDALVIENDQIGKVGLEDPENNTIVTVTFDAPLVGLWSPPRKNAPFVCIEPWYGRCDAESFSGELKDRDYEQRLEAGEEFFAEYVISV
ncbi:MAG: aldose 1-epimerase family protein [Lachnospiraceae bacterium]|nr:aldose 1-epimerase family protein [Lachnospiraceae bacterium]